MSHLATDLRANQQSDSDQTEVATFRGRILQVDDSPETCRLFSRLLTSMGLEITTAENGREAVAAVLRAASMGSGFDLILMDVQMPVMDGLEAAAQLRQAGIATPIVAISGCSFDNIERHCMDAASIISFPSLSISIGWSGLYTSI